MKRTIIALAVSAAVAAQAAYADVTLSGNINAGPAVVKSGDGSTGAANSLNTTGPTAQQGITRTGINTNYSNVTIGSMEDLGGGLKLDFAFQMVAPINSNSGVTNRNSHIGLVSDSWGGVWWGSNENLYERYLYTVDPLDGAAGIGGNLSILGTPGYGNVFDTPTGNPTNCTTTINGVARAQQPQHDRPQRLSRASPAPAAVYLDAEVEGYLAKRVQAKGVELDELVNELLKR